MTLIDPKPWRYINNASIRYASKRDAPVPSKAVFDPRRVLMTHPHNGHTRQDTCFDCLEASMHEGSEEEK